MKYFSSSFYQFESGRSSGVDLGLAVDELEQPDGRIDSSVVIGREGRGLGYHGRAQDQGLAHPVKSKITFQLSQACKGISGKLLTPTHSSPSYSTAQTNRDAL